MVANRTREIRPSGMKPEACGNVSYGGARNPPHIPKGCVIRKLSTQDCARRISIQTEGQESN